jgi:hypothetical protein
VRKKCDKVFGTESYLYSASEKGNHLCHVHDTSHFLSPLLFLSFSMPVADKENQGLPSTVVFIAGGKPEKP